jgi:hypothetical protein
LLEKSRLPNTDLVMAGPDYFRIAVFFVYPLASPERTA